MRDLSIKGVVRRHADASVRQRIVQNGGTISLRQHLLPTGTSLRARLESWARSEISFGVSECIYAWNAAYQQTWTHVVVRVALNPDAGISAAQLTTLRNTWQTAIETRWSSAAVAARSGELPCPFTFDVQWVNGNAHHTVRVRRGPERTNMTTWDTNDTGAVASHEFGHMLGNPDEYTSTSCPRRSPVNTGTIMDDNSNNIPTRLLERLAEHLDSNVVAA